MSNIWRWWTESWRSARRARGVYLVMAAAFALLAVAAGVGGDVAVAALAGVAAAVTGALAFFAPRWTRWMGPAQESTREETDE